MCIAKAATSIIAKHVVPIANIFAPVLSVRRVRILTSERQNRYNPLSDHAQEVHTTSHGSMVNTSWVVEGDSTATFELNGRQFASGDSGAPMICSMVCNQMGRGHLHIDTCRTDTLGNCGGGDGVRHINETNDMDKRMDWIVHDKFWERSGLSHAPRRSFLSLTLLYDPRFHG
jgi:hypothetical protein